VTGNPQTLKTKRFPQNSLQFILVPTGMIQYELESYRNRFCWSPAILCEPYDASKDSSKVPHDGSISEKDFRSPSASTNFIFLAQNIRVFHEKTKTHLWSPPFLGMPGKQVFPNNDLIHNQDPRARNQSILVLLC
jgi:hypothetical protein